MGAKLFFAVAIAAVTLVSGFETLAAQEPGPLPDDHWAIPPDEIFDSEPAEAEFPPPVREPRKSPLNLRLADDLLPDERERLIALLAGHPAWTIGEPATHEIAPDPGFSEHLLVTRVRHHSPGVPPMRLGAAEDEGFDARLSDYLHREARRGALLDNARLRAVPSSATCLGRRPSSPGVCELEIDPDFRFGQVHFNARIEAYSDAVFVTVIAIEPDGEVRLILNKRSSKVIDTVDGEEVDSFHHADNHDSPFAFGKVGEYHLLTIVSDRQIDQAIWALEPGDTNLPAACEDPPTRPLCLAMLGRVPDDPQALTWGIEENTLIVEPPPVRRVVRGKLARNILARWQAQLALNYSADPFASDAGSPRMNFEKAHKCGGSYIGDGYVLTAAHCIRDDLSGMRIRLGTADITRGGAMFSVHSVAVHARGSATRNRGDVALIRLHDPRGQLAALERSGKLKLIALAGSSEAQPRVGSVLTATGWGYQAAAVHGTRSAIDATGNPQRNPRLLQELDLLVANDDECLRLGSMRRYAAADIVCARGRERGGDVCSGDSGGPLMTVAGGRWVQVGIVSAGEGCAQGTKPAVYMSVGAYADWISRMKTALGRIPASQRPIRRTHD